MAHTIQETIELAVKTAILRAHPIGSYYLTEGTENPQDFIGGEWQKLTGRYVLQCSDANHKAGTTVEAGLPNINGSLTVVGDDEGSNWVCNTRGQGAFYDVVENSNRQYYAHCVYSDNGGTYHQAFDASRSNSIYGASTTVQPPARIVNVWKRVS